MPRCDLLVWILVVKLAPSYYRKLDRLLTDTGRHRQLPSWRKYFKSTWKKLLKAPITLPLNDAYRPDVKKWVCTCPALIVNRFLLCKHLVQAVQPVPPLSFLEVKHQWTAPVWKHHSLKPHNEDIGSVIAQIEGPEDDGSESDPELDEDDDEDKVELQAALREGLTYEEAMNENITKIGEFLKGLQYQVQFRDHRMLQVLEQEGRSFLRLADACLNKERRMQSTRGESPTTWEQQTSAAIFYHSRPTRSDIST
ncbi:hypothetical protein BU17DRAFT_80641 [Hysterangium stoloniferum]|nr:hypothetical protein BU17DRAFT_80641 [Hysterangium stoloniferum]